MSEFFVGYLPKIPTGIAKMVRRAIIGLFLGAALLAVVLVGSQHPFARSAFEFGQIRGFEGVIEEHPYPALLVTRPGIIGSMPAYSRYLLVGLGKHGADQEVAGFSGKHVTLKGKLVYRGGETLVEIVPGTIVGLGQAAAEVASTDLGPITLTGEIVDSKCYFGVMNPGEGKVHRSCATRCLSGGIPAAFISHEVDGRRTVYLLADANGKRVPSEWAAQRADRLIKIRGRLVKSGDTLILQADLNTFQFARSNPYRIITTKFSR